MAKAKPITLQVSDIVQWFKTKELVVNELFQRHSVWTPAAKTYLIDTILKELPLPKLYMRTIIDPKKQTSVREVVDGQQRVRAIVAFANNELRLTTRSEQFSGMKYEDLGEEEQQAFLGYTLTVDQLLNASDDDVIDVFARLNSYTVALNSAEKRHARFQTDFKFAVRKAVQEHRGFIEKYTIFTTRQRFRMADDAFFAETFGILLEGVKDGGARNIDRLYLQQDDNTFSKPTQKRVRERLIECIDFLDSNLSELLSSRLGRHYQILMLVAAYAHIRWGLPPGDLITKGKLREMPPRGRLAQTEVIIERLTDIAQALEEESPPRQTKAFVHASSASTQRIASRSVRFPVLLAALRE